MKQLVLVIESGFERTRSGVLACLLVGLLAACWGDFRGGAVTDPVGGGGFTSVTAGWKHSCALAADGKAWCWGENQDRGQLGNQTWDDTDRPVPVAGGHTFRSLSGGAYHTCGVTTTGQGYCWGRDDYGQLGSGLAGNANVPVQVAGNQRFTWIGAGEFSTCGLTATGRAFCWGRNDHGQLGTGMGASFISTTPIAVAGDHRFEALAVGHQHACGVTAEGAMHCWGRNTLGQLGNGTTTASPVPSRVVGGLTFSTEIGASQHNTCALNKAGYAFCWGDNWHSQVGNGIGRNSVATPHAVVDAPTFRRLGVGGDHACALTPAGEAWCWGDNIRGALGHPKRSDYNLARPVSGGLRFDAISGGGWDHFCAATVTDGQLFCWGWNQHGQLGDGTNVTRYQPVAVRFR